MATVHSHIRIHEETSIAYSDARFFMEPSTGIGHDLIPYHGRTARKKLRLALSPFAPAVLTYLICSAPRSSASAQCLFFTSHALPAERNQARLVPAQVNAGIGAIKITSE